MIMMLIFIVSSFFVIAVCMKNFFSVKQDYENARNKFIKYLYSVNDSDTLASIGEIKSPLGGSGRWYPSYRSLLDAVFDKYEENKNPEYLNFYIAYEDYLKKLLIFLGLSIIFVLIDAICIASFFEDNFIGFLLGGFVLLLFFGTVSFHSKKIESHRENGNC